MVVCGLENDEVGSILWCVCIASAWIFGGPIVVFSLISVYLFFGSWPVTTKGVYIRCPMQSTAQISERFVANKYANEAFECVMTGRCIDTRKASLQNCTSQARAVFWYDTHFHNLKIIAHFRCGSYVLMYLRIHVRAVSIYRYIYL